MHKPKYTEHIIVSFALITLAQLGYAFKAGVFSGQLADPDCYTWLVRAVQFQETRLWFDATLYRVDPPFGLEQHWTRPFDVLLLTGAWALTPFIGFEKGLYAWGVLISPVLLYASVLFLIWGFAPVYNHRQLLFLALGFIVMPAVFASYLAGRPDHHSLITFLFVVALGFVVRMMQEPARKLWSWGAGFVSALGFWVCIELGIFVILPIIVFFSVLWFLKEKDAGSALLNYSASLFIFSTGALLIENGFSGFFHVEVDRLSVFFILFFALITFYSFFIQKYDFSNNIAYRVLFSGAAGFVILLLMYTFKLFYVEDPQVIAGYGLDALYREVRSPNIGQHQLIYSLEWPQGFIRFIFWAGIIIPTSLWFAHGLIIKKWWQNFSNINKNSIYVRLSIFIILCIVLYAGYAVKLRYVVYLQIIFLLGYVVLMDTLVRHIELRFSMSRLLLVIRPLAIFLMLTWFFYPLALHGNKESLEPGYDSNIVSASAYIHNITKNDYRPLNIMAAPELGSTLLYHTNNNVFTFTNHRNLHGFNDWYNIMTSEIDEQALSIIDARQVDMILVNRPLDRIYFHDQKENALVHRLMAGEEVSWLERIDTPNDFPQDILIFMVQRRSDFYEAHHSDTLLQ